MEKVKLFVVQGGYASCRDSYNGCNDRDNDVGMPCKVYKRRWYMLFLFASCSACNASHWIQYAIISNIVMEYYNVSSLAIDWTSIIFMAAYVPLVFPATWLLEKMGLRVALLLGSILLAFGSWVKTFSTQPDQFLIGFMGQTIVGASQMFTLGVPARLAALWFPHYQVSTATAIGVFGNQVGIALGFVIPPMLVYSSPDPRVTEHGLYVLFLGTAVVATTIVVAILIFFEAVPPSPPSIAQKLANSKMSKPTEGTSFLSSLRRLSRNIHFNLLLTSYGLNIGAFYAYSTLLNQLITEHFPDGVQDAGKVGLTLVIGGVLGSITWGVVLDKTHWYKGTTVGIYCLSTLGMIGFAYSLEMEMMTFIYITSGFLGFFMNGYLTVGYEFGAELTYPESEATSSGLLNASGELFGIAAVLITGDIIKDSGTLVTNITFIGMLVLGLILSIFISGKNLRRLEASRRGKQQVSIS